MDSSRKSSYSAKASFLRIPALDGLRGIAIILVMFHHFQIIQPTGRAATLVYNLSEFGPHGVDLFFALSGFLITGILLDSRENPHYFRNFYARRALRIVPLYYLLVALSIYVLPMAAHLASAAAPKMLRFATAAKEWPWYVFYVSNFLIAKTGDWRHPVLGVTWSLAIEEQFYLVWAPLVYFLGARRIQIVALALILISVAARAIALHNGASWVSVYVLTPCRFDAIGLGAFLAAALRRPPAGWQSLGRISPWIAFIGSPVLIILYAAGICAYDDPGTMVFGYLAVAVVSVAWVFLAVSPGGHVTVKRILSSTALRVFGKYSYCIYLIHLPIRAVFRDTIFARPGAHALLGSGLFYQLVFYAVVTPVVMGVALMSWNLFESPILSLKRFFPE